MLRATAGCRLMMKLSKFSDAATVVVRSFSMLKRFLLEGVFDRRVLTADVDAGFGLITCERGMFDQVARLKSSVSEGWLRGSPDSSHEQ